MGFIDSVRSLLNSNVENFSYLERLINNQTNVVLDKDIEQTVKKDYHGILIKDDTIIDGDGHIIDARHRSRIFHMRGRNIVIKNLTIKNGHHYEKGNAILIEENCEIKFINCTFIQNNSFPHISAITIGENSVISIEDCKFIENSESINNLEKSHVYVNNCSFIKTPICGNYGDMEIKKCTLKDYTNTAIKNRGKLKIDGCIFQDNTLENLDTGIIHNENSIEINNSKFINNTKNKSKFYDIVNFGSLKLGDLNFDDESHSILNKSKIICAKITKDLANIIENNGEIIETDRKYKDAYNFSYLDSLIHEGIKEIKLEKDVVLDLGKRENSIYAEGILIDADDVIIDGNGHTIDAQSASGIFRITGNNTVIKNITLKNGYCENGGAINYTATYKDAGYLKIINSAIEKSTAKRLGGAIYSEGRLTITKSSLEENNSNENGGAIYNTKDLTIDDSIMQKNNAENSGGCIYTKSGNVTIKNVEIHHNSVLNYSGGAICITGGAVEITDSELCGNKGNTILYTESELTIANVKLYKNKGGAIHNNYGNLTITNSLIKDNISSRNGGAILNGGKMNLQNSQIEKNIAGNGGGIYFDSLKEYESSIKNCCFKENISKEVLNSSNESEDGLGGAIYNKCPLRISNCSFDNNTGKKGGAIYNEASITISDSILKNNRAEEGGAIIHKKLRRSGKYGSVRVIITILSIINTKMQNNSAENDFTDDISAYSILKLNKVEFDTKIKSIMNNYKVIHSKDDEEIVEKIYGPGEIDAEIFEDENYFNLNELIQNNVKHIKLEKNLTMRDEKVLLEANDIVIDGNGHTISGIGSMTFEITGENIVIKNLTLDNAGITNEGNLTLDKCIFKNHSHKHSLYTINNEGHLLMKKTMIENCAKRPYNPTVKYCEGVVINNDGKLEMQECELHKNVTTQDGLIDNSKEFIIENSIFDSNSANGILNNEYGEFIISGTKFINNQGSLANREGKLLISQSYILKNENIIIRNFSFAHVSFPSFLEISNVIISENNSYDLITNENFSNLNIYGCEISNNNIRNSVLINEGNECILDKTKIYDNEFEQDDIININNSADLTLKDIEIPCETKTILNTGKIAITSPELENCIENINDGIVKPKYSFESNESNEKDWNFTCLDNQIHGIKKEILLENDIILKEYEKDFYEGGIELDVDGLVIDGQGHVIDANGLSRIFLITGKDIVLRNIEFKNAHSFINFEKSRNSNGGVMRCINKAKLTIENCKFQNNYSEWCGGVIDNAGEIFIKNSIMENNSSKKYGGAAYNHDNGTIKIIDSNLQNNYIPYSANKECSGGAIYNLNGEIFLLNTILNENYSINEAPMAHSGTIYNEGTVNMQKCIIYPNNDHEIGISNNGKLCMHDSVFEEKTINGDSISEKNTWISNYGILTLNKVSFDHLFVMHNKSIIYYSNLDETVINQGYSTGAIYKLLSDDYKNFTYLDQLIHKGKKEISLENDILLDVKNKEELRYPNGILIDVDDLVIDGRGHSINAQNISRIFKITGKNISLKNITLKNGHSHNGGAINNEGNLKIKAARFINNNAHHGGAIFNQKDIKIYDSTFENNTSKDSGGAIFINQGKISLINSELIENISENNIGQDIWAISKESLAMEDTVYNEDSINTIFYNND